MTNELQKIFSLLHNRLIKNKKTDNKLKDINNKNNDLNEEILNEKLQKTHTTFQLNINKYQNQILNLNNEILKLKDENKYLTNELNEKKIDFNNLSEFELELYSYDENIKKELKSPLDIIKLNIISKSCCRLEYTYNNQKIYGNGFLIELPISNLNISIKGLMTSNNFINENNINDQFELTLIFNIIKKSFTITTKTKFKFTDYFLNFTFIELNDNEIIKLKDFGLNFLQINEDIKIPNNIVLIKNNSYGTITFEEGILISEWGFQIYHTIPDYDFIGAPLISQSTNKIISILTNTNKNCKYYASTNIKTISIIIQNIYTYNFEKIKYKVKDLTMVEIKELQKIGLIQTHSKFIFESPSSEYVTPLWFYRTNHNWYWTPTPVYSNNGNKNAFPSNWLIIYPKGSLRVVGGYWTGQEPAPRNITLIHWLEKNGFKYLV